MDNSIYQNPLCGRYASKAMQHIFSNDTKFRTWRKLWIALAESEQALGIPITDQQISELREFADDINYENGHNRPIWGITLTAKDVKIIFDDPELYSEASIRKQKNEIKSL